MQITPWDVALSWVVFVPMVLYRWRVLPRSHASCTDTPRVGFLPAGTGGVAWKSPFSSIITLSGYRGPRPPRPYRVASYRAAPSTVTHTRGYRGVTPPNCKHFLVRTQSMPEAWPTPLLTSLHPWWVLRSVDFGQRPKTGRYTSPLVLSWQLFSEKTKASPYRPTWHSADKTFLRDDVTPWVMR